MVTLLRGTAWTTGLDIFLCSISSILACPSTRVQSTFQILNDTFATCISIQSIHFYSSVLSTQSLRTIPTLHHNLQPAENGRGRKLQDTGNMAAPDSDSKPFCNDQYNRRSRETLPHWGDNDLIRSVTWECQLKWWQFSPFTKFGIFQTNGIEKNSHSISRCNKPQADLSAT